MSARRHTKVLGLAVGAALAVGLGWGGPEAASGAAGTESVFTVYLAPAPAGGSDSNNGLTAGAPVLSINRVEQVLRAARPSTDVEVRIKQGVYEQPPMQNWRFYVPGHTISFLPIDYEYGEGIGGIAGRPVFRNKRSADGTYPDGTFLVARPGANPGDPLYDGGTSGLRFYYLQVEYYSEGGIGIMGGTGTDTGYDPPMQTRVGAGLNGNTFFGMDFRNIGNKWAGSHYGWGAIVLTNSSHNTITNSHFNSIENTPTWRGYIHGVYVTHFSSYNAVTASQFADIGGNPVKTRDRSSWNDFTTSTFTRTGDTAYFRDDICDRACAVANHLARECAGYHNRFVDNDLVSGYEGGAVAVWILSPEGNTYTGGSPCGLPAGENRVITGGNT